MAGLDFEKIFTEVHERINADNLAVRKFGENLRDIAESINQFLAQGPDAINMVVD